MSLYHPEIIPTKVTTKVWQYQDKKLSLITPSENLRVSNDAEKTFTNTSYALMKEIIVPIGGVWRVKFDLKTNTAGIPALARIYRNGEPYGAEHGTTYDYYQTFTEDLLFQPYDRIQLYAYIGQSGYSGSLRNFRLCGDPVDAFGINTVT
jgi:hypothetical protein